MIPNAFSRQFHGSIPWIPYSIRMIRRIFQCLYFAACGFVLLPHFTQAASDAAVPLLIAEKGKTTYQIVLPSKAVASEQYAAEELQKYLQKITGAKLQIVTDATLPGAKEIILGLENSRLKESKFDYRKEDTGKDGFHLRTDGKALVIAGGRPRGTLNGVYTLLEDKWGVRWFTPEVEKVPTTDRLVLESMAQFIKPSLEARDVFWREFMRSADFAARHRVNGPHYNLQEKHGGPAVKYYPFVHSFDELIPRSLFKEHPEYFPMINGKRVDGYVQRCLSNPEVVRLAIEKVHEWIKAHPEANIISVSQNDTHNQCRCEECLKLDEAEGSPAATMVRFVNQVAQSVEKEYPNILIDTLAYQYTRKPPKTIRPRKNVLIRLCSIECCFAHSLELCSSRENASFRADIVAWRPVAPALYIWDYTPNFGHYLQPFPNFDAIQGNVQFFVRNNVKGLFEQGNYSSGGGGEMEPLRAYLLAKLLWNPDTDIPRHTSEFLDGYYGKSASAIRAYMERLHRSVRDQNVHAHIFDSSKAGYLNDGFLDDATRILDEAVEKAENDDIRFRLQMVRLGVWYVKIATNRVLGDAKAKLVDQFMAVARKAGITDIREGGPIEAWATKQLTSPPSK